jgi:hypothetical protein
MITGSGERAEASHLPITSRAVRTRKFSRQTWFGIREKEIFLKQKE